MEGKERKDCALVDAKIESFFAQACECQCEMQVQYKNNYKGIEHCCEKERHHLRRMQFPGPFILLPLLLGETSPRVPVSCTGTSADMQSRIEICIGISLPDLDLR